MTVSGNQRPDRQMQAITRYVSTPTWFACKLLGLITSKAYVSRLGGMRLKKHRIPELPGDDWVLSAPYPQGVSRDGVGLACCGNTAQQLRSCRCGCPGAPCGAEGARFSLRADDQVLLRPPQR